MEVIAAMVDRGRRPGTRRARSAIVEERGTIDGASPRRAWIVEDEPAAASLAADLCEASGAAASVFRLPLAFLSAMREGPAPAVVILDWRLENELSAALFMATRHQHPHLPIIFWTGRGTDRLPAMIHDNGYTRVVDKAGGTSPLEDALIWALEDQKSAMLGSLPAL
jgi:FixJ family two-component response regulator